MNEEMTKGACLRRVYPRHFLRIVEEMKLQGYEAELARFATQSFQDTPLACAFDWHESKEGGEFWKRVEMEGTKG